MNRHDLEMWSRKMKDALNDLFETASKFTKAASLRSLTLFHLGLHRDRPLVTPFLTIRDGSAQLTYDVPSQDLPRWATKLKSPSRPIRDVACLKPVEPKLCATWLQQGANAVGLLTAERERGGSKVETCRDTLQQLSQSLATVWRQGANSRAVGSTLILTARGESLFTTEGAQDLDFSSVKTHVSSATSMGRTPDTLVLGPLTFSFADLTNEARERAYLVTCQATRRIELHPYFALSARQQEVAHLASQGLKVREIALALDCSVTTIRTHLSNVYRVLGIDRRIELRDHIPH